MIKRATTMRHRSLLNSTQIVTRSLIFLFLKCQYLSCTKDVIDGYIHFILKRKRVAKLSLFFNFET